MPGRAAGAVLLLGGGLSQNAPQRIMSTAPLLGAYTAVSVAMDGASAQVCLPCLSGLCVWLVWRDIYI